MSGQQLNGLHPVLQTRQRPHTLWLRLGGLNRPTGGQHTVDTGVPGPWGEGGENDTHSFLFSGLIHLQA